MVHRLETSDQRKAKVKKEGSGRKWDEKGGKKELQCYFSPNQTANVHRQKVAAPERRGKERDRREKEVKY